MKRTIDLTDADRFACLDRIAIDGKDCIIRWFASDDQWDWFYVVGDLKNIAYYYVPTEWVELQAFPISASGYLFSRATPH